MRSYFYLLIFLGFVSCRKEEIKTDQDFTNLYDTLIYPKYFSGWGSDESTFNLNIDKEGPVDIKITVSVYHYHFYSGHNIQLVCQNGYEMAYAMYIDSTKSWNYILPGTIYPNDTLVIPKEYNKGDTIKFSDDFTENSLMISYYTSSASPGGGGESTDMKYGVTLDNYLYIAFCKQNEGKNILAWVKLKVEPSLAIVINSCRYIVNQDIFIIE